MSVMRRPENKVRERRQRAIRDDRRPRRGGTRREEARAVDDVTRPSRIGATSEASCAGSSSRSASWMAMTVPRARANPWRMAWPLPRLRSEWIDCHRRASPGSASSAARVPSLEPSLTMMISRASGQVDFEQPCDHRRDGRLLVEDRDDDRDERRRVGPRTGQSRIRSFASRPRSPAPQPTRVRGAKLTVSTPATDTEVHVRPSSTDQSTPDGPAAT